MSAQLLPDLYQVWRDANGNPLAGGSISTYQAGTTTNLATYTDFSAATPNANPIVLDSSGAANVWLSSSAYKFVIKDSLGNVIRTVDNVSYINPGSITKTMVAADLAGAALAQNGSKSFDVQVDNVTIDVNGSNKLEVKPGSITASFLPTTSKLEIVTRYSRDLTCPGVIEQIPQYEWTSPTLNTQPSILPPNICKATKWSPNGEFLAVATQSSPYVDIYQRVGSTLVKLPDPATISTGSSNCLDWSPCGDFLVLGVHPTATNPSAIIYQRSGNVFTAISFTSPSGTGVQVLDAKFSPSSDYLSLAWITNSGQGVKIYQRSGITFTDVTSGDGISANAFSLCKWSTDSFLFVAADSTTGYPLAYTQTSGVFTGITAPNMTAYASTVNDMAFSPDRKFFAIAINITPFILIFSVDPVLNTFTLLPNPAALPASAVFAITWSANSQYLGLGLGVTPFVAVYQVSGTTFTKQANLGTLPSGFVAGISWSPTKQFLAVCTDTTPFIQVYKTASTLPSDSLLWTRGIPNA